MTTWIAVNINVPDGAISGLEDQLAQRIASGLHHWIIQIDEHEVGFTPWREPANVGPQAAPWRHRPWPPEIYPPCWTEVMSSAAILASTVAMRISSRRLCGATSVPIPRWIPALQVLAEMLQQLAVTGEGCWTMGHGGSCLGQQAKVLACGPVQPTVLVDEDRMAECAVCGPRKPISWAHWTGVFPWRSTITRNSLTLCDAWVTSGRLRFCGNGDAVPEQLFAAGVDLHRVENTRQAAALVPLCLFDHFQGGLEIPAAPLPRPT